MAKERVINYHGGEKIYNKEMADKLLDEKQDKLVIDTEVKDDSTNPVENKAVTNAIRFAGVRVGETMYWPVSECVDRTVVSDRPFEFDVHGKHYSVDVPDGVVHLNISKDIPTDWHALDGTAELDAEDYPELAAFMPDNVITDGKIWLPYVQQKIIKIK